MESTIVELNAIYKVAVEINLELKSICKTLAPGGRLSTVLDNVYEELNMKIDRLPGGLKEQVRDSLVAEVESEADQTVSSVQ